MMNSQQFAGIARHVLTTVGGIAVAKGAIDAGSAELIAGSLSTLLGVGWSLWAKR